MTRIELVRKMKLVATLLDEIAEAASAPDKLGAFSVYDGLASASEKFSILPMSCDEFAAEWRMAADKISEQEV